MKFCVVTRVLWPGGVQRIAESIAQQLAARSHSVDSVYLRDSGRTVNRRETTPVRVVGGQPAESRALGGVLRLITSHYNPERGADATVDVDIMAIFEVKRAHYDAVIYTDLVAALLAPIGSWLHGDHYAVYVHETSFHRGTRLQRILESFVLSRARMIMASSSLNRAFLSAAGFSKTIAMTPGIQLREGILQPSRRSNVAVSLTMWDRGRHPERLVEIARYLQRGRIIVAGDWTVGAELVRFREVVSRAGLSGRIEVTGRIDESRLEALMSQAKVLIRFGYNELGPGMGALEGIGWGLPVVVNKGLGLSAEENLRDTCLLEVDDTDPASVARLLDKLFSDDTCWAELNTAARKVARALSWDNYGDRLEAALKARF